MHAVLIPTSPNPSPAPVPEVPKFPETHVAQFTLDELDTIILIAKVQENEANAAAVRQRGLGQGVKAKANDAYADELRQIQNKAQILKFGVL